MSEIWELLDETGRKTGKTMQKGEKIPEGMYHPGADVWILNSENKILLQKRSPRKKLSPNVWAMTGGSTCLRRNQFADDCKRNVRRIRHKIGLG